MKKQIISLFTLAILIAMLALQPSRANDLKPFFHDNPLLDDNFWAEVKQSNKGLDLVRKAIANGADIDEVQPHGPPLRFAIYHGILAAVPILIKAGADVNQKGLPNKYGSKPSCNNTVGGLGSALHMLTFLDEDDASENEILTAFYHLLAAGADINATDANGNTPLHRAFQYGTVSIINALLDAGADQTLWNAQGRTPYDLIFKRRDDHKLVSFFHLRNFYKFSNKLKKIRGTDREGCRAWEAEQRTKVNHPQS